MAKKHLYYLKDFSLGMNEKDAANLIPDNAMVEAQNAIVGRGWVSKRHGYQKYSNQLANPIHKLYEFYKSNGTKEMLAVSNLSLYKDVNGTLNVITGTLTSNTVKMMTYKSRSVQDAVLIADRGKLKVYNGTSVSEVSPYAPNTSEQTDPGLNDLANLTDFRALAIKKDRIFGAAHPTVKNRIHFCHHDPSIGFAVYDYWPAAFFIDVATEDNDEIVELKVFRDALIILCKRSIWALYGDGRTINDYELHRINVPSGCIAPESVQIVGNNLFYLSEDHVYSLFSTDQNYISAEIVSTVKQTGSSVDNTLGNIANTDKAKAVGMYYENQYFLSFPTGVCLVFNAELGAWVKWTNVQANSFLNKDGELLFSSNAGYVYQFWKTLFSDDGASIPFVIKLKLLDFKYPVQVKKIRRLWVVAKQWDGYNSTFDLKGLVDHYTVVDLRDNNQDVDTNLSAVWDESNWDEEIWDFAELVQKEIRIRQKGKSMQVIISNDKLNEPLSIFGVVFEYKVKKP